MLAACAVLALGAAEASGASSGWSIPPTGSCGAAYGAFGDTMFPPACWKPYGAHSPFNRPIGPDPHLDPSSDAIVARLVADLSPDRDWPDDLWAKDDGATGEPTYWSRPGDPLFTITCRAPADRGTCPLEGARIRIPAGAKPEFFPDHHLTVVDQASNLEHTLYKVKADTLPASGGPLEVGWAGSNPVHGSGTDGNGTASNFAGLAGRLRAEELASGEIRHALNAAIACSDGTAVAPATGHGGLACRDRSDAPPMGSRFQLDMTAAEIDALRQTDGADVPEWRERLYRAMATYGVVMGDTGGAGGLFNLEIESGSQYLAVGAPNAWTSLAAATGWERDVTDTGWRGTFRLDAVDWKGRLRVIAPCESDGTC